MDSRACVANAGDRVRWVAKAFDKDTHWLVGEFDLDSPSADVVQAIFGDRVAVEVCRVMD